MPPILLQSRGVILRDRTVPAEVTVIDEDVEDFRGGGGLFSHQLDGSAKGYWRCRLNDAARTDEINWDGKTEGERDRERTTVGMEYKYCSSSRRAS